MHNLDDPSQTSFYIPFKPGSNDTNDRPQNAAYQASWSKCFVQLRSEIESMYGPTIDTILDRISTSQTDILPGLPYPELPLIAVHSASGLFISALLHRLSNASTTTISHIYPSDAPNLSIAMKSLISNLLPSTQRSKQYKLASYDISMLSSYYTPSDPLLVILHDFEQFEPAIMQDLLYICSTKLPSLHLTFLCLLSSPLAGQSSFINTAYPRSALARLRIHSFSAQSGRTVLERLLLATFFDPSFEPDVVLGPTALEGIADYYTRHNGSIDALLTSIQLVHLKHFLTEPLSLLVHPPQNFASDPNHEPVLSLLQYRLPNSSPDSLLETLKQHEFNFRAASRAFRLGFILLQTTITFLTSKGYKPFTAHSSTSSSDANATTKLMCSALRGHTTREIKTLAMYIKKLRPELLHELLSALYDMYTTISDDHNAARDTLRLFLTQAAHSEDEEVETEDEIDSEEVSDWFTMQLSSLLKPLDKNTLWDLWYTGSSPFPSELLNPSPRASILSALLRPYDFTLPLPLPSNPQRELSPTVSDIEVQLSLASFNPTAITNTTTTMTKGESMNLHKFPDTSILFSRYLDSGKLINIHDWYGSFKVVLDAQRAERVASQKHKKSKGKKSTVTPKKKKPRVQRKKGVAGKQKATTTTQDEGMEGIDENEGNDEDEEVVEEPDEEAWQKEVQARFIRALHELDYLGFIKHTGRKVEHVARTVFEVGDEGGEEEGKEGEGEGDGDE